MVLFFVNYLRALGIPYFNFTFRTTHQTRFCDYSEFREKYNYFDAIFTALDDPRNPILNFTHAFLDLVSIIRGKERGGKEKN